MLVLRELKLPAVDGMFILNDPPCERILDYISNIILQENGNKNNSFFKKNT